LIINVRKITDSSTAVSAPCGSLKVTKAI
jgi:hypothetical protein